ncbi:hypothetical protein [Desulfococcus sp.]|uniref:hypothetical protein n=1 Tax=Desulfococcus sp. TaxID=2025834 RepID=UPI00359415B4
MIVLFIFSINEWRFFVKRIFSYQRLFEVIRNSENASIPIEYQKHSGLKYCVGNLQFSDPAKRPSPEDGLYSNYAHLWRPFNQESACKLEETVFQENGSKMAAEITKGLRPKT